MWGCPNAVCMCPVALVCELLDHKRANERRPSSPGLGRQPSFWWPEVGAATVRTGASLLKGSLHPIRGGGGAPAAGTKRTEASGFLTGDPV